MKRTQGAPRGPKRTPKWRGTCQKRSQNSAQINPRALEKTIGKGKAENPKNDNTLAKNDGLEEPANQDGVLARTWTSQDVRVYHTIHALLKTCWNYVLSVAGFRAALVEASPRAA